MSEASERIELLIQKKGLEALQNSTVMIVGVGGVGSYAAEALARSFVGHLILVDKDVVESSNLNRQMQATVQTLGTPKVQAMKDRIHSYNPDCKVDMIESFYDASMNELLDQKIDVVIDAIDTLSAKMDLIQACAWRKIPCISSLGMANRLDPTKVEITTLDKSVGDPLAKALRQIAKKRNYTRKIHVVFSSETPIKQNVVINPDETTRKDRIPPASMVFVPAASGLACASWAMSQILKSVKEE